MVTPHRTTIPRNAQFACAECAPTQPQLSLYSVEGFFGIFKRGLNGMYHHCGEQHLQRYLNEFAFCYSNRAKLDTSKNPGVQLGVNDT